MLWAFISAAATWAAILERLHTELSHQFVKRDVAQASQFDQVAYPFGFEQFDLIGQSQ